MKCAICQFENEDGALFCEQCKSDLSAADTVAAAPPAAHQMEGELTADAPIAALVVEEKQAVETIPISELTALSADVAQAIPVAALPPTDGAGIPAAATEPAAAPAEEAVPDSYVKFEPGASPKLVVVRGQRINEEYPIYEGENYIGRADEKAVDVDLEDQEPTDRVWSSRQHALMRFDQGVLSVEDLNSTNGTFVNRLRIHPGQKRFLQVNDVIQIGTVQMRVKV